MHNCTNDHVVELMVSIDIDIKLQSIPAGIQNTAEPEELEVEESGRRIDREMRGDMDAMRMRVHVGGAEDQRCAWTRCACKKICENLMLRPRHHPSHSVMVPDGGRS